ncbi:MAG: hypothetical protein RSA54_12985, partial [Glutamicibacter sp.]
RDAVVARVWLKHWYGGLVLNGCPAYYLAFRPFVDLLRSFKFAYSYYVPLGHPPQTAPLLKLQSSRVAWPTYLPVVRTQKLAIFRGFDAGPNF